MVANENSDDLEAWGWVDDFKHVSCHEMILPAGQPRPNVLHAVSHYRACTKGEGVDVDTDAGKCLGEGSEMWEWHKGHVPTQIMQCDQRLLQPPPDDFIDVQRDKYGKRRAFMICALTSAVNDGVLAYKQANCPAGYNTKRCIRIVRDPVSSKRENPDGYSRARVAFGTPGCS
jgi:hypothetical protein